MLVESFITYEKFKIILNRVKDVFYFWKAVMSFKIVFVISEFFDIMFKF